LPERKKRQCKEFIQILLPCKGRSEHEMNFQEIPFINEDRNKAAFDAALSRNETDGFNVLVFHGADGAGKTSLIRELAGSLEKDRSDVMHASLDFSEPALRNFEPSLILLRNTLNDRCGIPFYSFDMLYSLCSQRKNLHTALKMEHFPFMAKGSLFSEMADSIGDMPLVQFFSRMPLAMSGLRGWSDLREWWYKRGQNELPDIEKMEVGELTRLMPAFWAADLRDFLKKSARKCVVFIDTFEALGKSQTGESRFYAVPDWVRGLVLEIPEVLWVIGTRDQLLWPEADPELKQPIEQLPLSGLSPEISAAFLSRCGVKNRIAQQLIYKNSSGNPFLLHLQAAVSQMLQARHSDSSQLPHGYEKTFDLFFQLLDRKTLETVKILSIPHFLEPELCRRLAEHSGIFPPDEALEKIRDFFFVRESPYGGTWYLHELVRKQLEKIIQPEQAAPVHRFLFEYHRKKLAEYEELDVAGTGRRTAFVEAFHHGRYALPPGEFLDWFDRSGKVFSEASEWGILIPLHEEAVRIAENELGPQHQGLSLALNNLAELYQLQGDFSNAEMLIRHAIKITEETQGRDHPDVASSLFRLAELYNARGNFPEAATLFDHSLKIKEKYLGREHPEVAASLQNLAELYNARGNFAEAEPLFKRALGIMEKALGQEHPDIARDLEKLADMYVLQGNYAEAEPLFQRALEIMEKELGHEHLEVAAELDDLAGLYVLQGNYSEAQLLFGRALEIREKTLGPEHASVTASMNVLAELFYSQGKYAEAEPLFKRSLEFKEQALGSEHPDVVAYLHNLAGLYSSLEKYDQAESLFKRALNIQEKIYGPEHPDIAVYLNNLAEIYQAQGRYAEAEPLLKRSRKLEENT
jgi:tetratricopeptide (TPR) repeat protein